MSNVLIAVSEKHFQEELKELLSKEYEVNILSLCKNSEEVLKFMADSPVDIVFVDINLPGGNGLTTAFKIRSCFKDVFIVLIAEDKRFAVEAFEVGVSDFLLKPLRHERVKKVLERAGMRS